MRCRLPLLVLALTSKIFSCLRTFTSFFVTLTLKSSIQMIGDLRNEIG